MAKALSNLPPTADIKVRVQSTLPFTGTVLTPEGTPADITGASISGKFGAFTLTATITDAVNGEFSAEITPAMTPAATTTSWYLDMIDSFSRVTPIIAGAAYVQ